jgi:signal transduction histidine kinase
VGQLAHALNEMAARVERNVAELRETARRKQQLVDNVAHELRTPLTAVGGYAEYIQRAELSEEEKYEAAQYIVEEANRLAVMSERLLQMAALRGEQAAREPVDVPALLEKAARTVAPKAAARGVAREPVQADACTVQGEAALLESLMGNLADNAVKACGPGGSVRLCARRETGRLMLTVQDTGRGMDAETLAHIGEPFYRPDKAAAGNRAARGWALRCASRSRRAMARRCPLPPRRARAPRPP